MFILILNNEFALWNVLLLVLNTAFCEDELWISVSVTGGHTTW